MGQGIDPSGKRREAWEHFSTRWALILHNPTLSNEDEQQVWLPLRQRWVWIRSGSTRHGPSTGRAIDLMLSTGDLDVRLKIHNSVNCRQSHIDLDLATGAVDSDEVCCPWHYCLEYASGDHLLIEAEIWVQGSQNS